MKKKMAISFGQWLILIALILMAHLFTNTVFGWIAIIFVIAAPIFSWGINFIIRKHMQIHIVMPTTASKGQSISGQIRIANQTAFSTGRVYCNVKVHNLLTNEKENCLIDVTVPAKAEATGEFELGSQYCGYLQTTVSEIILTDWFGFLPVKCKIQAMGKTSILPDTFLPHVSLTISYARADDAENWSPIQKGQDYTEVFALRDYMEGDSLKQIHWKLSSKKNQLIVKEASLPTTKSLLLFWDKNTGEVDAQTMDAIAEVASSVAQAISEQGVSYCLGWTEGKNCEFENIDNEDELLQTIPRMVKTGVSNDVESGACLCAQIPKTKEFGKVIYFAKTMPEDFEPIGAGDMTMILASETVETQWPTYNYQPDSYQADLQAVEL